MLMGWIASRTGRWTRMLAGASMMVGGLARGSAPGRVMALLGLLPLMEGAFDVCVLGPLFGLPIQGEAIRRKAGRIGEDSLLPHPPLPLSDRPVLLH
ncbi:YgaP-like transmembrane domain [Cystobacter ferrugineus]|uniref:Inner membrane protein YgaP-like transmembrane domain-containing protein n=1 Tax=Cystobacter ferrugineus TaxID=83449 RepID=A0A1L9B1D2_9BACT|nr:YgaP-like transmembrane domain [Cystobacter ferrugineus]OJH36069.1 hypothetical protein BON30_36375 [Cystobacter ferrugineus]